jgi:hypothetical protein
MILYRFQCSRTIANLSELWNNIIKDSGYRTTIDVQEIDHFDQEEEDTSTLTGTYSTILSKCSFIYMISLFP